jgi:hypothetical protein
MTFSPDFTRVLREVNFFRHCQSAFSLQLFAHATYFSPAAAGSLEEEESGPGDFQKPGGLEEPV